MASSVNGKALSLLLLRNHLKGAVRQWRCFKMHCLDFLHVGTLRNSSAVLLWSSRLQRQATKMRRDFISRISGLISLPCPCLLTACSDPIIPTLRWFRSLSNFIDLYTFFSIHTFIPPPHHVLDDRPRSCSLLFRGFLWVHTYPSLRPSCRITVRIDDWYINGDTACIQFLQAKREEGELPVVRDR